MCNATLGLVVLIQQQKAAVPVYNDFRLYLPCGVQGYCSDFDRLSSVMGIKRQPHSVLVFST